MRVYITPVQLQKIIDRFKTDNVSIEKFMDWCGVEVVDSFVEMNNGTEIDADNDEIIEQLNGLYHEVMVSLGS